MKRIKVKHINLSYCRIEPIFDARKYILYHIWQKYGVKLEGLQGKSKKKELVFCRYLFSKYMYDNYKPQLSHADIGKMLHKDHATINHYLHHYQPIFNTDNIL